MGEKHSNQGGIHYAQLYLNRFCHHHKGKAPDLTLSRRFSFLFRLIRDAEVLAMLDDNGIELLLNFPQQSRWVDARKIPVDMLLHDIDERQKFSHR